MPGRGLTRQRLRFAFLALALALFAWHAWDLATPGLVDRTGRLKAPDFLQFYAYGHLARAGEWHRLYDPAAHEEMARTRVDPRMTLRGFLPNYSPIVALLMAPLASLPFLQAWVVWSVVSLILYVAGVSVLARITTSIRHDALTLVLAALAFPALYIVVRYGQISALSFLLLALAGWLYARERRLLSGLLLGGLAYKPNLLILPVIAFVATREWRVLGGLLLAVCLETATNLLLVGSAGFAAYLHVLVSLAANPDLVQTFPTESHSIRGFVRLLLPQRAVLTIATLAAIGVGTWAVHHVWRQTDDVHARWAALALAMLAATPHLLTYDLLLLGVPLVLVVDRFLMSGTVSTAWWVAMLLLYGAAWPGTFLARLYGIQLSTVGMGLALWLLVTGRLRPTTSTPTLTSDSSSSSPIISS